MKIKSAEFSFLLIACITIGDGAAVRRPSKLARIGIEANATDAVVSRVSLTRWHAANQTDFRSGVARVVVIPRCS